MGKDSPYDRIWRPTRVGDDTDWASVSAGGHFACALKTNGTLWCWGDMEDGNLGIGHKPSQLSPVQVGHSTSWATVSTGAKHTLATKLSHAGWAWGTNDDGEVGDGTTTDRWRPVRIS